MSVVVPRLSRDLALTILEEARSMPLHEVTASMPREMPTGLAPVGREMTEEELGLLRRELLALACEHGFPGAGTRSGNVAFDAQACLRLRRLLDVSPNEAAAEDVWSYLTCCWLLDIALWRFGDDADSRRFVGDVNRNAFRRLWWRAEVLGGDPASETILAALGEDELVNIMERPALSRDRRLARCIARVFVGRLADLGEIRVVRMDLMRDVAKRLRRLTPFTDLSALGDEALEQTVAEQMDLSRAALSGRERVGTEMIEDRRASASPNVERLDGIGMPGERELEPAVGDGDLAELALDVARRTGRVTNGGLRELIPGLTADEARATLVALVNQGCLERRGEKRGRHYVIPQHTGTMPSTSERPGVLRRLLGGRR